MKDLGKWAFLIGVVLSVLSAFTTNLIAGSTMMVILFILGIGVGFLNIDRKNYVTFLLATLVLLVLGVGGISALSEITVLGLYGYVVTMLGSFVAFVGAAALVVAIKSILDTSPGLGIIGIIKK